MMRIWRNALSVAAVIAAASSCADTRGEQLVGERTAAATLPPVRVSEFHYDNTGTDTGEAIEVSGPAGTDLTGWTIVPYNGNGFAPYTPTLTLSGTIPATCGDRGVVVVPAPGLQNGAPDAFALVDGTGAVVELLSYEGTFTAVGGPANGLTSVDVGVAEVGTEPIGTSLARNGVGEWSGPAANTFGACNDSGVPPPPPAEVASVTVAPATATVNAGATQAFTATALDANGQPVAGTAFTWSSSDAAVATVNASGVATGVAAGDATITATAPNGVAGSAALHVNAVTPPPSGDTLITEIHYDNSGTDSGEAIEIEGPLGVDLTGWSLALYDGTGNTVYSTTVLSGSLVTGTNCSATRGVLVVNYPVNGIQNGSPDAVALVDATGAVKDFIAYEGSYTATVGPAAGLTAPNIGEEPGTTLVGNSLQRNPVNTVWSVKPNTFGACNSGDDTPAGNTISFSGRVPSDPPLPVGYEDQIFGTLRGPTGSTIPTTFTWSSETPAIASIDANGVMRALAEGTATIRATAADGTTATYSLPTRIAVASTTASYIGNAEFGEPTDSDPADDYVVRYEQYTASYNPNRGSPNWVAYELDPTHYGPEDRCDCFTFDDALPFAKISTADYTGAGAAAGFGIDRGHLARSFDRTSASLDNARTFLFTNIVPQAADLNQGPWANFENFLGDLARTQDKEVYIVTGVAGNKGTLKNEGKVVIPTSTWKVAVIMPHDQGLDDVVDYRDLEVIAVNMPNDPGVRNVDWNTYRTTVDAVEAISGYDLLALLPDATEAAVESGTQPPLGATDGPYAGAEGGAVTMSAAASIDPNGSVVSVEWDFGDGATATGDTVTHVYAQDGEYTVRAVVTDNDGLTATLYTTASVANVAPVVGDIAGATLLPGESFTASGSFTDPGADAWTASVDWGDGSSGAATVTDHTFSASHTYAAAGSFTVTVTVADDDTTGATSQTVTVLSVDQALQEAIALVDGLISSGKISYIAGTSLKLQLNVARTALRAGYTSSAIFVVKAVIAQVDGLVTLRRLAAADAAPLRALLVRIVAALE